MNPNSFQIDVSDDLLVRARCGELAALETIYRRFERPAFTLALRMTTRREDARDVVHDAMLRMFERIGQFRGDSPFWGWLRQIVVNEALMRLRRDRAVRFEEYQDDHDDRHAQAGDESTPWSGIGDATLERAMAELPVLTRSVLWLFHVEGYTHPEIAELTGNSVSFSKSQLSRGTQRLRAILHDSLHDTTEAAHG